MNAPTKFCLALVASSALLAATGASPQSARRDSAGVRIVEYQTVRNAPDAFAVEPRAVFTLGGPQHTPERELNSRHPFLAMTALGSGDWAVVDWDHVKLFDAGGRYKKSFGRGGSGPGEFKQLLRVCRIRGDTLLAIDYTDRRLSLWTGAGTLVRAYEPIPTLGFDPCFGDGTLLATRTGPTLAPGSTLARRDLIQRIRIDGSVIVSLGNVPAEDYFEPVPRRVSVLARGERVIIGDGSEFEVRAIDWNGTLQTILRVRGDRQPMPRETWERGLSRLPPAVKAAYEVRSKPEFMPAYGRLESDGRDRLWIRDYLDSSRWTVFDRDWALLGTVRLPKMGESLAELVGFSGDHIVLRYADSDGFAILAVHRLVPARR